MVTCVARRLLGHQFWFLQGDDPMLYDSKRRETLLRSLKYYHGKAVQAVAKSKDAKVTDSRRHRAVFDSCCATPSDDSRCGDVPSASMSSCRRRCGSAVPSGRRCIGPPRRLPAKHGNVAAILRRTFSPICGWHTDPFPCALGLVQGPVFKSAAGHRRTSTQGGGGQGAANYARRFQTL